MKTERPYDRTYQEIHGLPVPTRVAIRESDADIFSPGRGFMGDFDWTMQLQVGCPGGCLFCYVSTGFRLAPSDVQDNWGFEVRNKRDIQQKLMRHLRCGLLADKTIYASGVTDIYASEPGVTRLFWETLCDSPPELRPRRIAVQTRYRPDRDADLMARYGLSTAASDHGPAVLVSYSIGTDREDLIKAWERTTPGFESRMEAIESLRRAGVFVVATLSPLGLWKDLRSTLERLKSWGVAYITVLFFKEHTGATTTPKGFLQYLHRYYPELLDPAWQTARVGEMQAVYGRDRVLVGQAGFASLAMPHTVGE